jgi:pimeloyl-ACP methyl ester carboxylesterase
MAPTRTTHATADDGTRLAVHLTGDGDAAPLLCLPGGPMLDSGYLRELGGLAAHRAVARLDLRGTGGSGTPTDPASYRCDRQVADVESVRRHLGLDRFDLFAHSAGANLAYAAHDSWMNERRDDELAMAFGADGAFDPESARGALAALDVPVLVLAGALDSGNPVPVMAQVAAVFRRADFVVQQGAGHFPWVDDPEGFVELVAPFLDD